MQRLSVQTSSPAIDSISFDLPTCIDNVTLLEAVAVEIDGVAVAVENLVGSPSTVTVVQTLEEGSTSEYCLFFDADFPAGDNR